MKETLNSYLAAMFLTLPCLAANLESDIHEGSGIYPPAAQKGATTVLL